jgi:hypothetical protein
MNVSWTDLEGIDEDVETWDTIPDDAALAAGIAGIAGVRAGEVAIVSRAPNAHWTTFASEFVEFRLSEASTQRVFCKYGRELSADPHSAHGHRHGVPYEADVYRSLLAVYAPGTPTLFGAWSLDGVTCLATEAIGGIGDVRKPDANTVVDAATWIGRFHRAVEEAGSAAPLGKLARYDTAYLRGWIERTREWLQPRRLRWLDDACDRANRSLHLLVGAPGVAIHGEYYPHNILCDDDGVHPIDWESAAVGCGEVDIATLTDAWDRAEIDACNGAYCLARWEGGMPEDFARTLYAARLHVQFRWLGDRDWWTASEECDWRLDALERLTRDKEPT